MASAGHAAMQSAHWWQSDASTAAAWVVWLNVTALAEQTSSHILQLTQPVASTDTVNRAYFPVSLSNAPYGQT